MGISVYSLENGNNVKELSDLEGENSFDDISRHLPDGVYTTFRTQNGAQKVFGLHAHLNRLFIPAVTHKIEPSVSKENLRSGLRTILESYGSSEARVRICLSLSEQPGQLVIMVDQLKLLSEEVYRKGVELVTVQVERDTPRIKSSSFIQKSSKERKTLQGQHIFEGLMVRNGKILEGLTSNFYAVKKTRVITARRDILLGVTRRLILRLLRTKGMEIEYRPLRIGELGAIDEAFITSSSRGVVPVISVDGITVGEGKPGYVSGLLRNAYDDYVSQKAEFI